VHGRAGTKIAKTTPCKARVLDGRWGVEHIAIAIPRGREAAMEYLRRFVAEAQTSGLLAQAVARAGLRGVVTTQ